jgi:hypothetical protein
MRLLLLFTFIFSLGFNASAGFNDSGKVVTEMVLANYAQVKTIDDFIEHFAKSMSKAEKNYIRKNLSSLKALPEFTRSRDGFVVIADQTKLYVDLTQFQQGKIAINGNTFPVHKDTPIYVQVNAITGKLQQRPQSFTISELFIPKAFAEDASLKDAIKAAATAATAAIKETANDTFKMTAPLNLRAPAGNR